MRPRTRIALTVGTALAATGLGVGAPTTAFSHDGRTEVTFTVTSDYTVDQLPNLFITDLSRCTFDAATGTVAQPCIATTAFRTGFTNTVAGDLDGVEHLSDDASVGTINPTAPGGSDLPFVFLERLVITSGRCGSGSLILQVAGNLASEGRTWTIVAGTGTSDLTGVNGSGTGIISGAPGNKGVTTYTGSIRCHRHRT